MARIHFLNVKDGDCSIIEHNSGNVTVVDVCNAKNTEIQSDFTSFASSIVSRRCKAEARGIMGDFRQKEYPVKPIFYMHSLDIKSIFRYIQTHPDMDHMDGIKTLFETFTPLNFWDTNNTKEMQSSSWERSPYSNEDWKFYKRLRDEKPQSNPKRLALLSGDRG